MIWMYFKKKRGGIIRSGGVCVYRVKGFGVERGESGLNGGG